MMKKANIKNLFDKDQLEAKAADDECKLGLAEIVLRPAVQAAVTLEKYDKRFGDLDLTALVEALDEQTAEVKKGDLGRCEEMLTAQAHTLDAMFNGMARRAVNAEYRDAMECYMKLALRAQSQCRATVEALSEMKNPRNVSFVRQANITNGPQQVNNGTHAQLNQSRTEENHYLQNKLLSEQLNGPPMDPRATRQAVGVNPAVETVGAINWPPNC